MRSASSRATIDEPVSWESTIYIVNNRTTDLLHTTINKGREGNAYLNYIMENYDNLRDVCRATEPQLLSILLTSHR